MKIALLILSLAFFGCSTTGITVPRVPAWVPTAAPQVTQAQVIAECSRLAPFAVVETSDATFTPLAHAWIERAADWTWHFAKATGIVYTAESFDCDKFALGFALAANIASSRAGVKAQPLLARIHVLQTVAWGGAPAGGAHAINGFLSERGIYVLDPQSRALVPLADYPNRAGIFRIKIGG